MRRSGSNGEEIQMTWSPNRASLREALVNSKVSGFFLTEADVEDALTHRSAYQGMVTLAQVREGLRDHGEFALRQLAPFDMRAGADSGLWWWWRLQRTGSGDDLLPLMQAQITKTVLLVSGVEVKVSYPLCIDWLRVLLEGEPVNEFGLSRLYRHRGNDSPFKEMWLEMPVIISRGQNWEVRAAVSWNPGVGGHAPGLELPQDGYLQYLRFIGLAIQELKPKKTLPSK